jgi:imidazolonepropionase
MSDPIKLYGPFNQIVTMTDLPAEGPIDDTLLQVISKGGIRVKDGFILEIGPYKSIKQESDHSIEVPEHSVAIPGFIDVHTHMCWAGNRSHDYALRLQGATYQEIAARGGGILDTVKHTRAATVNELAKNLKEHVRAHMKRGVTTCEVKSGYGLSVDDELKMLEAIEQVNRELPPTLISTCLAAHVRPPEFDSNEAYLDILKTELLPKIREKHLSNRVDIFIEKGAFTCDEAEDYLTYAKELGFTICAHVDQFHTGGSEVTAKVHALSADHLETTTANECAMLKESGVIPVVLPGASIGLGIPFAPARMLLDHGLPLVIASDWNPGSAPNGDLLTQAAMLGANQKLSMSETMAALTIRASHALKLKDRGTLATGKIADFLIFPTTSYQDILYYQGSMKPDQVIISGKVYH